MDKKENKTVQNATFNINVPNSNLNIQRTLPCINDLHTQDLFSWKTTFIEPKNICSWDENTAINVLEATVHTKYLAAMRLKNTRHDRLNTLFQLKYPTNLSFTLSQKLANLKQEDFYTIEEYTNKIDKILRKLAMIKEYNNKQYHEKREETFYAGLTDICKLEMTRLNVRAFAKMYEIMNETEKMIVKQERHENHTKSKNGYENIENSKKNNAYKSKWYHYHKSKSHDSKECRHINNNKGNETKNYTITEKKVNPRSIEIN
ncbi:hypothetical protein BDAP_001703 [Binucleata daphniae]